MIRLDYRDARPIYEQIKDELRHLVVAGALAPGEKLPSVRALASSLAINPNTIQRAYQELEAEGYLKTEPGRGCFASAGGAQEGRRTLLLQQFDKISAELRFLGVSAEDLSSRLSADKKEGTSL